MVQSAAEEARFERARKMTEVESRKRYEFLEAMVSSMDAHLRFFERGHEVPPAPLPPWFIPSPCLVQTCDSLRGFMRYPLLPSHPASYLPHA